MIKISEIFEKKELFKKLASVLPDNGNIESVFFFPIELEEEVIESEVGVSMFRNTYDTTNGISSLITYGIAVIPGCDIVTISAAYYDRSAAIQVNMNNFLQVMKTLNPDLDVESYRGMECRLLKKASIVAHLSDFGDSGPINLNESKFIN